MSKAKTDDMELQLTVDNRKYRLRLSDFTGEDDLLVYQKTGCTIAEIFMGKLSLFTLAALVWAHRRKREPKLTYEAVNRTMNFEAIATLDSDAEDDGEGSGPEA